MLSPQLTSLFLTAAAIVMSGVVLLVGLATEDVSMTLIGAVLYVSNVFILATRAVPRG